MSWIPVYIRLNRSIPVIKLCLQWGDWPCIVCDDSFAQAAGCLHPIWSILTFPSFFLIVTKQSELPLEQAWYDPSPRHLSFNSSDVSAPPILQFQQNFLKSGWSIILISIWFWNKNFPFIYLTVLEVRGSRNKKNHKIIWYSFQMNLQIIWSI